MPQTVWRRLLREPLVHFLALGAVIFALWGAGDGPDRGARRIVVGPGEIGHLVSTFRAAWQREPTPAELDSLVAEHIKDEVYYREALAMGIDRDDTVVRRRMRQKMELMITGLADTREPGDGELAAWHREHADRYRSEPRVTLRQVHIGRGAPGEDAATRAQRVLAGLRAGGSAPPPEGQGDSVLLPPALHEATLAEVAGMFGSVFAETVASLPVGEWQGPLETGYGLHLVRVDARAEGGLLPLAEVRDAVRRDWLAGQTAAVLEQSYRQMREKYAVVMEPLPAGADEPLAAGESR